MGWWKDFANSLVETTAAGLTSSLATGVSGEKSGLGSMLSEGTQSDFDKYVSARQAAVKGEYDKYTQKFDAFEEQAKQFAGLVGSPSSQNLGTELDGMEVAARYMQGKSQAQINDTIAQLKKLKAEGKNIREVRPDLFKRGADQEIRNYTAQDIARMQLGGAFSYTPKPYDLSKRRTGLARFLRDDLGLYGETFAKEREALAERQARDITAALPGYDKYAGTGGAKYDSPQASLSFAGADLRTEAEKRAERIDIAREKLTNTQVKQAEQTYLFAQNAEKDRQAQFKITMENSLLDQQFKKGQLSKQEYELQKRDAEDAIVGKPLHDALAAAITADRKNPTPETAAAVLSAQEAVYDHSTSLGFYDVVKKEVERRKEYDPRFKSKKRAGKIDVDVGAKEIVGFETPEAALQEETKIWEQSFIDAYKTLSPTARERINFKQFGLNVNETFRNSAKEFFNLRTIGSKAYGEKTTGLQELEAGIAAAYPDMSDKDKEIKLQEAIQFAAKYKIQLTGGRTAAKPSPTTTVPLQEGKPVSGMDVIEGDIGEDVRPTQSIDIGDQAPKGFVQRRPIAIRGMNGARKDRATPNKKSIKEIDEEIAALKKQLESIPEWTNRGKQKQQQIYDLQSQRLEIRRANQ